MRSEAPFHEGEIAVQERTAERELAARNGKLISDTIAEGAVRFVARQSLVVLGSVDPNGQVWASALFGESGFASAGERSVTLDLARTVPNPDDPLWSNLRADARVGLLFIELSTRRRLRINGDVLELSGDRLQIGIREAFPNCPKYIQRRELRAPAAAGRAGATSTGTALDFAAKIIIERADTFFVASVHAERGLDASHRGGRPGFVRILDERTLRVPDYAGNSMFTTLGNLAVDPRAGLVFIDFETGDVLQLTGRATLGFDGAANETGGTGRFWELAVERWQRTPIAAPADWELLDYSPVLP